MKTIETIGKLCPNATIKATQYRNQWIVNGRWIGTYQNWEVTPGDATGSRKNRKSLRDSEIKDYVNEGTLPDGFESRSFISGGMGSDEAKLQLKAGRLQVATETPLLDALAQQTQTETVNLEKPMFDAELFKQFLAFKAMMDAQK